MILLALAGLLIPALGLWRRYHLDESPREFCLAVAAINRTEAILLLGWGAVIGFAGGGPWWLTSLAYGAAAVVHAATARQWHRLAMRTPA